MDMSHQKTVLHNLELRLAHIRAALSELTDIQTELQKNATESKNNIQANFSRQLENLRTREVYLVNQVDTLLQVKQEHLHLQADSLKKELGALQALQEHTRSAKKAVDLQDIEDIMKRFQEFHLEPEENGILEFVSDPKRLKKCILTYGSINPKRFCPSKDDVQGEPRQIMAPFEKYACDKVWLTPNGSSGIKNGTTHTVFPIFQENQDAEGWLAKDHDIPVMETCQSEKSDDDQDSFVMIPKEHEQSSRSTILSQFASILNSPNIQWIRRTPKTDGSGASCQQLNKPAYYSPSGGTKGWLKKETCHPSQVPVKPIEIEDLAEMACVQDTPSGAPSPCGPKTRPRQRTQRNQKNTCCSSKPVQATTTDVNIDDVCKGNEKCKTFDECLCDENCADTAKGGFDGLPESSKNRWLSKGQAGEENRAQEAKDARPEEELPKEDFVKEWLAKKTAPEEGYESVIISSFLKWQLEEKPAWLKKGDFAQKKSDQTSISQWLFKKTEAPTEPMVVDNKEICEDAPLKTEWLLPRSPASDGPALKVPTHDSTSWLLKGKNENLPQESKMDTNQDGLQEKWLIKQTTGGFALPTNSGFTFASIPKGINQWLKQ
ncbi:nuclear receptor coactivator 4-like [Lytechinus variegatus]|uniref:nuclear receptor coactivator 4-like n=1 Tax=Lytechinus variegatus TaxID=7654 RepID=UPI001BB21642|nr:nuclear receptor coactivator 4-like [Lytechinus variegatus]